MVKKCLDSSRTVCQVMKCEYEFHVLAKCYLRTTWFNTNIVHTIVNGKTTTCRVLILYEKRFQQHININIVYNFIVAFSDTYPKNKIYKF